MGYLRSLAGHSDTWYTPSHAWASLLEGGDTPRSLPKKQTCSISGTLIAVRDTEPTAIMQMIQPRERIGEHFGLSQHLQSFRR